MKRFWQFLFICLLAIAIVGCSKKKGEDTPTPTEKTCEEDPTQEKCKPVGPTDKTCEEDPTQEKCQQGETVTCAEDPEQEKCKDPETWDWKFNRYGFNGKKMTVKVLSGAPEEVDPYSADFTGTRKDEKKKQFYEIAKAYNITLSIEKFPDSAAWGPDRVAWINSLAALKKTTEGDIFAISSDWVPSLVEGNSIAELEVVKFNKTTKNYEQISGIFSDLKYTQAPEKNKQYMKANKVYGYSNGNVHADFFLYYNKTLVDEYGLEDPAQLWNEGRWDWTSFYNYLVDAQTAFNSQLPEGVEKMYAFGGWGNEVVRGALAARGGKFIDPDLKKVLFTNATTIKCYNDLRKIVAAGMWSDTKNDVCINFTNGTQLFQPAQLWFMTSSMRFVGNCDFEISIVPYPTADGDGSAKATYTIPMANNSGWAIRNADNDTSGLTNAILFNIIDDMMRGIKPEFSAEQLTDEEAYRVFLSKIVESRDSIEAIMSVENNLSKYGYTDYLDVVSKYVGNGSDWQGDGFYTWGETIFNLSNDPATILAAHQENYQTALNKILAD